MRGNKHEAKYRQFIETEHRGQFAHKYNVIGDTMTVILDPDTTKWSRDSMIDQWDGSQYTSKTLHFVKSESTNFKLTFRIK